MIFNILKIGISPIDKIRQCFPGQPCDILKTRQEAAKGNHTQNFSAPRRLMVEPEGRR